MFCNVGFAECIKGDCNNGQGTYTFADGGKFVGEFKEGKQHGQGTFTWADGRVVKGIWKDGKLAEKAKKKKTSSRSSKEENLIKRMMETENWTEKQAKCLVKKTKPLVKKEDWNKYVKIIMQQKDPSDDDVEIVMGIGLTMVFQFSECGVPPKQ